MSYVFWFEEQRGEKNIKWSAEATKNVHVAGEKISLWTLPLGSSNIKIALNPWHEAISSP